MRPTASFKPWPSCLSTSYVFSSYALVSSLKVSMPFKAKICLVLASSFTVIGSSRTDLRVSAKIWISSIDVSFLESEVSSLLMGVPAAGATSGLLTELSAVLDSLRWDCWSGSSTSSALKLVTSFCMHSFTRFSVCFTSLPYEPLSIYSRTSSGLWNASVLI